MKVGDKVRIKQHVWRYCGASDCAYFTSYMERQIGKIATVKNVFDNFFYLDLDGGDSSWSDCMVEKITKEVPMLKAQFGIKYDRDTDPVEFFATRKDADKRIQELLEDSEVDKTSIVLFEVGKKWEVKRPVSYELKEVKS